MELREFTQKQLTQAGKSGFISRKARHSREPVVSYPIDNKPPESHSDRDDAFHVEALPEGGYTIHIHIADVAAHIPKTSPLDIGALERSFTRYRPQVRDPMFPIELSEGRMSLEHRVERMALSTVITLDALCRPQGIEFRRTLLTSEAHDYDGAAKRMRTPGDPFYLMERVAKGILNPKNMMATYDETTGLKVDNEGMISFVDPSYLPVTRMVETYMVMANRMVAEFAHQAELPFLYRNHSAAIRGNDPNLIIHNLREVLIDNSDMTDKDRRKEMRRILGQLDIRRAKYEPEMKGHFALNLSEGYAHFTSPIRRYADLINQRMVHYALEQLDETKEAIALFAREQHTMYDEPSIHNVVWHNATALLAAVHETQEAGNRKYPSKLRALERAIHTVIRNALPHHNIQPTAIDRFTTVLALDLIENLPPYDKKELKAIAAHINKAANAERSALKQITVNKASHWVDKMFPNTDPKKLAAFTPNYFSSVLEEVCKKGLMNEVFHHEILKRMDNRSLSMPYDAYSLLVVAKEYTLEPWRTLKKRALREIEKDGMEQISHIFSTAQNNQTIPTETDIVEGIFQHSTTGETLHAARVVTEIDGRAYSAPHYSLAHSDKGARKRAIYDFVCSLTFKDLVPMEEAVLPSKHYAELASHKSTFVLEKISKETHMMLEVKQHISKGQVYVTYIVRGDAFAEPLSISRHSSSAEDAQRKAARAVLRSIEFKRAAAEHNPVMIDFGRKPETILEELIKQHNLPAPEIEITPFIDPQTKQRRFQALLMMEIPGQEPFIITRDNTIKRMANRQCCRDAVSILRNMGITENEASNIPPLTEQECQQRETDPKGHKR